MCVCVCVCVCVFVCVYMIAGLHKIWLDMKLQHFPICFIYKLKTTKTYIARVYTSCFVRSFRKFVRDRTLPSVALSVHTCRGMKRMTS